MPKQPANDPGVEAVDGPTLEGEALKAAMARQGNVQPFSPDGKPPAPEAVEPTVSDKVIDEPERNANEQSRKRAAPAADDHSADDGPLKDLPRGYVEHIEFQPRTGCYAAGYTPRAQTEAVYLGDDFRSEDEARRAIRNDAANDAAF